MLVLSLPVRRKDLRSHSAWLLFFSAYSIFPYLEVQAALCLLSDFGCLIFAVCFSLSGFLCLLFAACFSQFVFLCPVYGYPILFVSYFSLYFSPYTLSSLHLILFVIFTLWDTAGWLPQLFLDASARIGLLPALRAGGFGR